MKICLPFFVVSVLLIGCNSVRQSSTSSSILDVERIAGKDKHAVIRVLGTPVKCLQFEYFERCTFKQNVEIFFIDGLSDWIEIGGGTLPYSELTLQKFGIELHGYNKLRMKSPDFTSWIPYGKYAQVMITKSLTDEKMAFILVKVKTLNHPDFEAKYLKSKN